MPVKRASKKVRKTSRRSSRRSSRKNMNGGAKRRSSKNRKTSRRKVMKGGKDGKVNLIIGAESFLVTDADITKAQGFITKNTQSVLPMAMKVVNLKTLVDKYESANSTADVKEAVLAIRRAV